MLQNQTRALPVMYPEANTALLPLLLFSSEGKSYIGPLYNKI